MYIIAKTQSGIEYLYSIKTAIQCRDEAQAAQLAQHLNDHNADTMGEFQLKAGEKWHVYEIDKYDTQPPYRVKTTRGKISVTMNY